MGLAACSGKGSAHTAPVVRQGAAVVTVTAGKATTLDLGDGADLIIPPGAMTPGAKVHARYDGAPTGSWRGMKPTSPPVELISDPPNAIHGLLTLEFPVSLAALPSGTDPANAFGISTYDNSARSWLPVASSYDPARHMVVALIPHFSWWNPITWDWDKIWAGVTQGFGQLVGSRAGPARCSGTAPSWVNVLAGVTNDADVAMHACAQSQGDILDVQLVNNRPYGQVLTYGGGVKWGWHEPGDSPMDKARNNFMDQFMKSNQLYIPPRGRASVGIFPLPAGHNSVWHIGPTRLSVGADFAFYLAGQFVSNFTAVGGCSDAALEAPLTDISPGSLRDDLTLAAGCVYDSFMTAVSTGQLDKVPVQKLGAALGQIKKGALLAEGIQLAGGVTWKIADLVADWYVNRGSELGNGFSVLAKAAPAQSSGGGAGTGSGSGGASGGSGGSGGVDAGGGGSSSGGGGGGGQTSNPPPVPSSPPGSSPPPAGPVTAYDNYGPANAGHAMCRGNPGRPESMPGGTASQSFTVPGGVATLSGAVVQIDPDSTVTAHLSVSVNGSGMASADAVAAGDTRFAFGPINVAAGDSVTIAISFTATYGKIITVYTAGTPGGVFSAANSCPDGAPNLSTSSTGLRATVSGTS
jgi:hypothetical protein